MIVQDLTPQLEHRQGQERAAGGAAADSQLQEENSAGDGIINVGWGEQSEPQQPRQASEQ